MLTACSSDSDARLSVILAIESLLERSRANVALFTCGGSRRALQVCPRAKV
jgi:hypothetical protein